MANYSSLKSAVTSVIKTNGNKEITGAVLQSTLLAIINSLGDGFLFKGVATPSTNPGTPDQNVFYIGGAGTYTNFNNLEVPTGYLGVLKYNGVWAVSTVQVGAVPVNDLTTGGTTVPLSAEMGKTLKTYHDNNATAIQTVDGKVSQLEAEIDMNASGEIPATTIANLRIGSTKISSNTSDTSFYIPVRNGQNFEVRYTATSGSVRYAYTTEIPANNVATTGYGSYATGPGEKIKNYTSPVDGYFCIGFTTSGLQAGPVFTGDAPADTIGSVVAKLVNDVSDLNNDISSLEGRADNTDGDVAEITAELKDLASSLFALPYSIWEMGSFNPAGEPNSGSSTRCRTRIFIPVKSGDIISCGFGQYRIYFYNTDTKAFISNTDWGADNYIFTEDALVKLLCRISASDETFTYGDENFVRITGNMSLVADKLTQMGDVMSAQSIDIEYGSLDTNGQISVASNAYLNAFFTHFRTSKFLVAKDITLVFAGCTPMIYEYTPDFSFIRSFAYSGKYTMDNPGVGYIKIGGEITDPSLYSVQVYSTRMIEQVFNRRRDGLAHTFLYRAFPSNGRTILNADGTETEYTATKYIDSGFLRLPPNYNPKGTPVKLLLWCQSSGEYGTMVATHLSDDYEPYYDYLAKEGFAIFSAYGWTTKYGDPREQNFAKCLPPTPTTMASIRNAYEWVCRNYNIDRTGIYISGKSFGGCFGAAMMFQASIPVKAIGLLAPLLTIREPGVGLGYTKYDRIAYCEDSCFVNCEDAYLDNPTEAQMQAIMVTNARLFLGYDATLTNMRNKEPEELAGIMNTNSVYDTIKRDGNNVALKIWVAKDDTSVGFNPCKYHIDSIVNGGGNAEIREMPSGTGAHHAVDSDTNALKVASLRTRLGFVCTNIPLAYAEMVDFFNQH